METIYNISELKVSYSTKIKSNDRIKIKSSKDSATIMQNILTDSIEYRETFLIICLNRQNQVLGYFKVSEGGTSATVVDAKIIFQIALNCNASAIILGHNHPSGNLNPSEQDNVLTKQLVQGGKLLQINVLDHCIVTEAGYYSYADEGKI